MKRFIAVLLFCSIPTTTWTRGCPTPPAQRDLVILPDTASEESFQALGHHTVNELQINNVERLLASEATPVLIELSIWKRFAKKLKDKPLSWFDEKKYLFYKLRPYILCIPLKWKQQFPSTGFHLQKFKRIKQPLKILPRVGEAMKPVFKTMLMLVHVYTSLVRTLRILLVPTQYAWNIVLFGHGGPMLGSYQSRVAGIPFREFKKLLRFLQKRIRTNIFLYSTCYAGSKWLLKVYTTLGRPNTYSFPIIITGITEAPVYGISSRSHGIIQETDIYRKFFQEIKQLPLCKENINKLGLIAGILLQALRFNRAQKKYVLTTSNNILQIRWPRAKKFEVIHLDNIIQSAKESGGKATITVTGDAFVINTPVVKKNIRLTDIKQTIVSSIPDKRYFISSITIANTKSREQHVKQLLNAFASIKKLSSPKKFFIGTLQNAKNTVQATKLIVSLHSLTPSSLIKRTTELFYTVGKQGYLLTPDQKKPIKLKPRITKRYLNKYTRAKKRLL